MSSHIVCLIGLDGGLLAGIILMLRQIHEIHEQLKPLNELLNIWKVINSFLDNFKKLREMSLGNDFLIVLKYSLSSSFLTSGYSDLKMVNIYFLGNYFR